MNRRGFIFFKAILCLTTITIDIAQSSCVDTTDKLNVGWTFNPTCGEILAYSPELCQNKNEVMVNCPRSCGTCGFDPYYECHETKGKKTEIHALCSPTIITP